MSVVEVVAAVVVGVALFWLVAQPLLFSLPAAIDHFDPLDPEETPRGQALLALKEIEFDRATGKLSDADYTLLQAKYSAAAIDVLDGVKVGAVAVVDRAIPSMTRTEAPASPGDFSPRYCAVHGLRPEPDAVFCSECGLGLVTDGGNCAACNFSNPADARFCAGCGTPVRT